MNDGHGKERSETCRETFPADGQAAVLSLEPPTHPLGLEARHVLCDRPPPRLPGLPHSFRDLRPDPACPESMTEISGLVPLIRGQHFEPFARSAPFAGVDVESIQHRDDLGPFVAIGGC
jgi:hypothetical protein